MGVAPASSLASSLRLTAGLVASAGLGLLFHVVAARGLGPSGYGAFAAALTYAVLWAIVMDAGISVALTREAAADPARLAWLPRLARWKAALAIAGALGALASGVILGVDAPVLWLIGVLALGMIGSSGMRLASAGLRVAGAFGRDAALATVQRVLLVALAIGALAAGAGTIGVAIAFAASYGLAAALALAAARTSVPATRDAPPRGFLWRVCLPLGVVELLTNLYFKVDQILLLELRSAEETGLYAAAYRVIEAALLLVGGVMGVVFLRLAAARADHRAFARQLSRAFTALWLAGLAIATNGWLWAGELLPLALGPAYAPARGQLDVLLGAVPLAYVNYALTQSLVARGRERFYAAGTAVCALVNVGMNLALIPRIGALGAAWASVATEATLLAICLVGLGGAARAIPVGPAVAAALASGLAIVSGGALFAERPTGRAVLALAVSLGLWEALSPWPLRRLAPAALGRAR